MAQTRVTYTRNPDSKRALGLPLEWYWEEHDKFYMGVGLETYRDEDGIPCTRAVWIDGRVHDFGSTTAIAASELAAVSAHLGKREPITLEIFDLSTPDESIFAPGTENSPATYTVHRRASGGYVIRYRHHPELGTIDLEDPLSLPLAKLTSNGDVAVGMALARHREYSDAGPKEVYLVIFEDGPGQVATRKDIVEMNAMFAKTPGLIPLVVEVVGL